ncbi:hypothetical protein [Photorhabdus heterorhabditis]|uniref:hypothetical protein n=1 Tax=Photorhabdus heterorhabditis TaxID=880156 RepID=UPI001FD10D4E|nr:hypothetical protein [Photorhabdus heterorhabditis]
MNLAKSAVPSSRKINGKALNGDVSLSAGDVGAYPKGESDERYQPHGNYQPVGNYAVRGECYTRGESENRYQKKVSSLAPRVVWEGFIGNGGSVNLNEDIKGKFLLVSGTVARDRHSLIFIPSDGFPIEFTYYESSITVIRTSNNGRTVSIISLNGGLSRIVALE